MMGSFITRGLVIIAAMLTVLERFGDAFISWVPMYDEAKLAFFIYLWYPRTKGTTYVYETFLQPYLSKHETEIVHNLLELRVKAGDMAVLYWQKAASYGQTRFFKILQYASQSSSPRPMQQQQQTSTQPVRTSRVASAAHQAVGQQGERAPPHGCEISPTKEKQGPVRDAILPSSQASVAPQAKQPSPQPQSPSASQPQGHPQRTSSRSAVNCTTSSPKRCRKNTGRNSTGSEKRWKWPCFRGCDHGEYSGNSWLAKKDPWHRETEWCIASFSLFPHVYCYFLDSLQLHSEMLSWKMEIS